MKSLTSVDSRCPPLLDHNSIDHNRPRFTELLMKTAPFISSKFEKGLCQASRRDIKKRFLPRRGSMKQTGEEDKLSGLVGNYSHCPSNSNQCNFYNTYPAGTTTPRNFSTSRSRQIQAQRLYRKSKRSSGLNLGSRAADKKDEIPRELLLRQLFD